MADKIYNINFTKLSQWLIPNRIKSPRVFSWLKSLLAPFNILYVDFLRFRKNTLYDLAITPQVCYMEAMLNDRYDGTLRRIFIADVQEFPPVYLYMRIELKPVFLYRRSEALPVYLYTRAEGALYADDFIVMVPNDIVFSGIEMRGMVMRKRLPGFHFKIQKFTP